MHKLGLALGLLTLAASLAELPPAVAQNEQFIPMLVYRTGPFSPNGVPPANGFADYYTLGTGRVHADGRGSGATGKAHHCPGTWRVC